MILYTKQTKKITKMKLIHIQKVRKLIRVHKIVSISNKKIFFKVSS